jgi:hypothetical protein
MEERFCCMIHQLAVYNYVAQVERYLPDIIHLWKGIMKSKEELTMIKDGSRRRLSSVALSCLWYGWPIGVLLVILWFPFDWLSEVWPMFGVPFRRVFRDAHDHFVGHTIFFFIIGTLILCKLPILGRRLHWYVAGLIVAALVQEAIQAGFRGEFPTFTDFNVFRGDALGGIGAWVLRFELLRLYGSWKKRTAPSH